MVIWWVLYFVAMTVTIAFVRWVWRIDEERVCDWCEMRAERVASLRRCSRSHAGRLDRRTSCGGLLDLWRLDDLDDLDEASE